MVINKRKIINDPVHGFITIPDELIFDIIEHPYIQRLRNIKQLGLTYLVYPGAVHSRFQHTLGAMHLMMQAVDMLKIKGQVFSGDEYHALLIAILMHDSGHGPFSHALEYTLVENISHEKISYCFMNHLSKKFGDSMNLAIDIFTDRYKRKFLHQLVSSQLDVDRLDYLMRDSFFSGVSEGVISTDRIIKMLNVFNDTLVVDSKGIYSVEKFIVARRLMYWQVYLHKTVLSAEHLLIQILKRARFLLLNNEDVFTTPALKFFTTNNIKFEDFLNKAEVLDIYAELDDYDVFLCVKMWAKSSDKILSMLSKRLIDRNLFKIEIQDNPFDEDYIKVKRKDTARRFHLSDQETSFFVFSDKVSNNAYNPVFDKILMLYHDDNVMDITKSSEQINTELLSRTISKFFLCYPKEIL